jgi:hypothetical protein
MSRTIPVSAQWALKGKHADGQDYRILACSTGDLNQENFEDALSRFQPGELADLQVSLSYARLGTEQGVSYLALAIHWQVAEGQCLADGVSQYDKQGRPIAYTSYFCLPYKRLADEAIGYPAMYDALRSVKLTAADGPPRNVSIAMPTSRTPTVNDLAVRVAPLLLTGRPVCVLGAESTGMLERLKFIDAVMDLLPYGFRARMTAATWTRATNRPHRFRLFFADVPRADEPDHQVIWGGDLDQVRPPDGEAGEYFDWLQDNIAPLAKLAELTGEMSFSRKDTIKALAAVLDVRHRFHFRLPVVHAWNDKPEPPPALVQGDVVEEVLVGCAEHAKLANPTRLRSDIAFLKKYAEGEINVDRRGRYQHLTAELGLLRRDFPVKDKYGERLYGALLPVVFGTSMLYRSYCRMEKCAGLAPGDAPRQELLAAIGSAGMTLVVSAIVHWHLGQTDEKKLNKWLVSGQVNPVELIDLLSVDWSRTRHARIVCDVTLEFLKQAPGCYQPQDVRLALLKHGFLARALQRRHPDEEQYQIGVIHQFLKAAYPQAATTPGRNLNAPTIQQILKGAGPPPPPPPTPALLSAVLLMLDKPEAWQAAWEAYIHGSVTLPNFGEEYLAVLRPRLPHLKAPQSRPERDPAQPSGDVTGRVTNGPPW